MLCECEINQTWYEWLLERAIIYECVLLVIGKFESRLFSNFIVKMNLNSLLDIILIWIEH